MYQDQPINYGKKYILVAEDDKFYANIYQRMLEKEGYEVKTVKNGEEVIKTIKEKIPDLLLLDLIMPVKDGFQVLKELKADERYKNINVIVVSNLGEEEDVNKIKLLGVTKYLVKANMSIQEVIDEINKYLESLS